MNKIYESNIINGPQVEAEVKGGAYGANAKLMKVNKRQLRGSLKSV